MQLATFKFECTPPAGSSIGFGGGEPVKGVRDPLMMRGIVLETNDEKCVIISLDFAGLMLRAYDELADAAANAAGVPAENVLIHCIHQHDAPLLNFEIEDILGIETYSKDWWNGILGKTSEAVTSALGKLVEISDVGHSETRLHGYASARRIINDKGELLVRYSKTDDENIRNMPTGNIDPFLRTVAFRTENGDIAASMSFYATHPQVANGRDMYSADAPGEAMRLLEEAFGADSFPCFFTGAGGNVAAGKYTSCVDLEGNLLKFGKLLADGITRNLNSMVWEAAGKFDVSSAGFEFPYKPFTGYESDQKSENTEVYTAVLKSCYDYPGNKFYTLRMLTLGNARILFFPGEPFVEYQLYAQSLATDEFIAVAGNCSDNFLYMPLAESIRQGGYEVNSFRWCSEALETELKKAIRSLIQER